jgi:hypothetical protein
MKTEIDDLEDTYDVCISNGNIREKNSVDKELIKSLKDVAERGIAFIDERSKGIKKESLDWTFVFRDYYEALRGLMEAFLLFDKVEAESHQCKNAYICIKHPELELDWNFLEIARLKRNAINYRGKLLNYDEWNLLKPNFSIHISTMKKQIEKKLQEKN